MIQSPIHKSTCETLYDLSKDADALKQKLKLIPTSDYAINDMHIIYGQAQNASFHLGEVKKLIEELKQ